jgi:hypothetical protein
MRTRVGIGVGAVVTGLLGAALAVGCGNGDDDDQGLAFSDGGVASGHDSGTAGGGGKSEAGAVDSGMSTTSGIVAFQAGSGGGDAGDAGVSLAFDVTAVFERDSNAAGAASICGAAIDGCTFCDPDVDGGASTDVVTAESAGNLTITDGTTSLAELSYLTTGGFYDSQTSGLDAITWQAGDVLAVSGTGATFPAFSGSVTAPGGFTGVTPVLAAASPVTVSTSGFTLAWTPQSDSATVALVIAVGANGTNVTCTAADSAGQIAVAPSLLGRLAALGSSGDIQLSKQVSTQVTVTGNATVRIEAQSLPQQGAFTFSN